MEQTPQLRSVEAFPVQAEGEELVCLRDPMGFAEAPVFLNKVLAFLVSRMNGENNLRDIQADFFRATGEILPMEHLEGLVEQLDEQHYLESERFRKFFEEQVRTFMEAPVRPARHRGTAYESDPGALEEQIRGFYTHPEGPGSDPVPDPGQPIRGLVAPHIDFHRGGPTYAHAYRELTGNSGANRFILFGTCHTPMERRFALTRKHFETPFGTVETDTAFVEQLASKLTHNYFLDEFSHRGEHSLEFQAVFLKRTFKESSGIKMTPILVGSFHDFCDEGRTPAGDNEVDAFVSALRRTIAEIPGRYVVIAGADLAHVGRRFGDSSGPTPQSMQRIEHEDLEFLRFVVDGDAEGMFRSIVADKDARRVCGYPSVYMALRTLEHPSGRVLQYRQWADFDAGAAVTFAAVALH